MLVLPCRLSARMPRLSPLTRYSAALASAIPIFACLGQPLLAASIPKTGLSHDYAPGLGGTTRTRTLTTAIPVDAATCLRTDSVKYRRREAQAPPTTPIVSRPFSIPALATARASRAGRAARTCSTTNDLSCDRALSAVSLFPVRANNSLTLLGFCIATAEYEGELHGKNRAEILVLSQLSA